MGSRDQGKVLCICDGNIVRELNKIAHIKNRANFVFELIKSYQLLNEMDTVKSVPATYEELIEFHSTMYIDAIKDIESQSEEDLEEIGLSGDCPILDDMYSFISHIAGGSLTAAKGLLSRKYKVAINWCGGWHHAQRDMAEGFCYVNDIVLAILQLCKQFDRILYIDLDVHHGNGVENAFSSTQKVFTFSLHRNGVGFYPNTGDLTDIGSGKGKYYSANVPFQSGTSDKSYLKVFHTVIKVIRETFRPDCLVVQCGADSLARDELGDFNLSSEALGDIISHLKSWSLPTLYLGGGGYNILNTARYWTYLTSLITSTPISTDIPDECEHFIKYGPDFTLPITPTYGRKDENSEEALTNIISTLVHNISLYVTSPGGRVACLRDSNDAVQRKRVFEQSGSGSQEKRSCLERSGAAKISHMVTSANENVKEGVDKVDAGKEDKYVKSNDSQDTPRKDSKDLDTEESKANLRANTSTVVPDTKVIESIVSIEQHGNQHQTDVRQGSTRENAPTVCDGDYAFVDKSSPLISLGNMRKISSKIGLGFKQPGRMLYDAMRDSTKPLDTRREDNIITSNDGSHAEIQEYHKTVSCTKDESVEPSSSNTKRDKKDEEEVINDVSKTDIVLGTNDSVDTNVVILPNAELPIANVPESAIEEICTKDFTKSENPELSTDNFSKSEIENVEKVVPEAENQESAISKVAPEAENQESAISKVAPEAENQESAISKVVLEAENQESAISKVVPEAENQESAISKVVPEAENQESAISKVAPEAENQESAISELENEVLTENASELDNQELVTTDVPKLIDEDLQANTKSKSDTEELVTSIVPESGNGDLIVNNAPESHKEESVKNSIPKLAIADPDAELTSIELPINEPQSHIEALDTIDKEKSTIDIESSGTKLAEKSDSIENESSAEATDVTQTPHGILKPSEELNSCVKNDKEDIMTLKDDSSENVKSPTSVTKKSMDKENFH